MDLLNTQNIVSWWNEVSETKKFKSFWIVSSNRWNSAVTEYALNAAKALSAAGHTVVFSPLKDSPAEKRGIAANLSCLSLSAFGLQGLLAFRSAYQRARPDCILLFGGPETFLAKFVGGKKYRVWAEAARAPDVLGTTKGKFTFSHLEGFIVPSMALKNALGERTKKPVHFVMLGIDQNIFYRKETMGAFLQKRPQVIILGRFDPVKGHERALKFLTEAFERWQDHQRRPCLHIIGEPANLSVEQITMLVEEKGLVLGEDVILSSNRFTNIHEVLSQAILGLIPSLDSEIVCRVGQEFLMCGTPVVVSGVGSLNEILFNEAAGASYAELKDDHKIASLVMGWVDRSMSEGEVAKRKRAQQALKVFGLNKMACDIEQVMEMA
jgi:glycosyltransferase involved in cell wall biosynthesis